MATFAFRGRNASGFVSMGGVTFYTDEPAEMTDESLVERLRKNPEFEEVHPLDRDGDGEPGGSLPVKRRGRRPKSKGTE